MKDKIAMLTSILVLFFGSCQNIFREEIYRNPEYTVEERVKDLLERMTLQEKTRQMQDISFKLVSNDSGIDTAQLAMFLGDKGIGCGEGMRLTVERYAADIAVLQKYLTEKTRLGIPALTTSEALHGCVHPGATIFPQAIAQGSTFNPQLIHKMAGIIAREVKAQGTSQVLSPVLDLARELRWGRVEETFGEDPYLAGRMGVAFVHAFRKNKITCTPKHFAAHGSPRSGLNLASVAGGERELRSVYLRPFEAVIKETHPMSVMNAYSSYDGIPAASNHFLLTRILREELGFKGYVYSDWEAVQMLYTFQKTASCKADAALQAVNAGLDVEIWSDCFQTLDSLVLNGILPEAYIDTAVSRILRTKFSLGLFDDPLPPVDEVKSKIHTEEAVNMALEVARESAVLVKNEGNILPLHNNLRSIALIGPSADHVQFGDYSWTNDNKFGITPLQGIKEITNGKIKINYALGCDHYSQNRNGFADALKVAANSDLSVIFVGSSSASPGYLFPNATSGESYDLSDLRLPGVQEELVKVVHSKGKPVIVVLVSGKPFAIPWIKENIPGIIVQWYPGEQGGRAIAEILFGRVNPSGKLNVSFPQSVGHLPVYYNHFPSDEGFYKVRGTLDRPGKDYVFSGPDPLWAFGTGLSYTTFDYVGMNLNKDIFTVNDTCIINVTVKNTGRLDGKEVIQLYVRDMVSSVVTPVLELKRFEKVSVRSGESCEITFILPVNELYLYNANMAKIVEPGEFDIMIGSASDRIKLNKIITII